MSTLGSSRPYTTSSEDCSSETDPSASESEDTTDQTETTVNTTTDDEGPVPVSRLRRIIAVEEEDEVPAGNAEEACECPTDAELDLILYGKENGTLDGTPEPELEPAEKSLPEEQRKLCIIIRKCKTLRSFNCFDLSYLMSLMTPPYRGIHGEGMSSEPRDAIINYGIGPEEFYVTWLNDRDKPFIMERWLSDEIITAMESGRPACIPMRTLVPGKMVAAANIHIGHWARARVTKVDTEKGTVDVYFVDHGVSQKKIAIKKIQALPAALSEIPYYAMKCKLHGVDFNANKLSAAEKKFVSDDFIYNAKAAEIFKCQLMMYNEAESVFEVNLFVAGAEGRPKNFNVEVQRKYLAFSYIKPKNPKKNPDSDEHLMVSNAEVSVAPFTNVPLKGLRRFRVTHIETPSDFRVEYVMHEQLSSGKGAVWQHQLNELYSDSSIRKNYELCTEYPLVRRCYVVQAGGTEYAWQRCRVLERFNEKRTCAITLLDTGMTMEIPFESFYEMEKEYANFHALGFRAYLVDVAPYKGAKFWSKESVAAFRDMVHGKTLKGTIVQKGNLYADNRIPQLNFLLGLILVDETVYPDQVPAQRTINSLLCRMNLADASGIGSGLEMPETHKVPFSFEAMKNALEADPTIEIFDLKLEEEGPFVLNVEPVGTVTPNVTSEQIRAAITMSKDKTDEVEYPVMQNANFLSASSSKPSTSTSKSLDALSIRRYNMMPQNENLPKVIRDSLGACLLGAICSPSCFYFHTMESHAQLEIMTSYLKDLFEAIDMSLLDEEIHDGLHVAFLILDENQSPLWYRGIVRQAIPSISLAKVIRIDYGDEMSVRFDTIRRIPSYFSTLPALAYRAHLDVPNLVPYGLDEEEEGASVIGWPSDACIAFRKYLSLWQKDNPIYFVWRPPTSSIIQLDDWGQELGYDTSKNAWVKLPLSKQYFDPKHHFFENLSRSIGVDIIYESLSSPGVAFKFEKAWEILVQLSLAKLKKEKKESESEKED